MSWSPHKEAEFKELQQLRDAQAKEREGFNELICTHAANLGDSMGTAARVAYLEKYASEIRDLLEPFDTRPRAPSYANAREELEHAYQRLSDIAKAVKPLRDWYFVHDAINPDVVIAGGYGHTVRVKDIAVLIEACPSPGSIVDTHA